MTGNRVVGGMIERSPLCRRKAKCDAVRSRRGLRKVLTVIRDSLFVKAPAVKYKVTLAQRALYRVWSRTQCQCSVIRQTTDA
jgi:hypothetical protein